MDEIFRLSVFLEKELQKTKYRLRSDADNTRGVSRVIRHRFSLGMVGESDLAIVNIDSIVFYNHGPQDLVEIVKEIVKKIKLDFNIDITLSIPKTL